MRILLTRLTNERHALEIVRDDGSRDRVELETKSLWLHDFLHLAVEAEAGLQDGFWGSLAAGKTFAEMNDRIAPPPGHPRESGEPVYEGSSMLVIEILVGALSGALKGVPLDALVANIRDYFVSIARAGDFPTWLTADFVDRVQERVRKLVGHWNATPFGEPMELEWKSR
jgi:hypothetical protein